MINVKFEENQSKATFEKVKNNIEVEKIKVETKYYYISPYQLYRVRKEDKT